MDTGHGHVLQVATKRCRESYLVHRSRRLDHDMDLLLRFAVLQRQHSDAGDLELALQQLFDGCCRGLVAANVDDIGHPPAQRKPTIRAENAEIARIEVCLLYTSDAADDLLCV